MLGGVGGIFKRLEKRQGGKTDEEEKATGRSGKALMTSPVGDVGGSGSGTAGVLETH